MLATHCKYSKEGWANQLAPTQGRLCVRVSLPLLCQFGFNNLGSLVFTHVPWLCSHFKCHAEYLVTLFTLGNKVVEQHIRCVYQHRPLTHWHPSYVHRYARVYRRIRNWIATVQMEMFAKKALANTFVHAHTHTHTHYATICMCLCVCVC